MYTVMCDVQYTIISVAETAGSRKLDYGTQDVRNMCAHDANLFTSAKAEGKK